MKINIPKGFFDDKSSVTLAEFLAMFTDMVEQVEKLEEDLNHELETDFKYMHENTKLKQRIQELETVQEGAL